MRKQLLSLVVLLLFIGCKVENGVDKTINNATFNQNLADELEKMVKIDQIAAFIPQNEYKKLTKEEWNLFKDSVFTSNQKRAEKIFEKYGFVGFDLAGKKGSSNFWLLIQHSDHNPKFQKKVLKKMKVEVLKQNANPSNYAYLVDRVKINTRQNQIYGSQVDYNIETGQAFAKKLDDSINVNMRRKLIGIEPIEDYLNEMSELHFEINKELFLKRGITKPKLYKTIK